MAGGGICLDDTYIRGKRTAQRSSEEATKVSHEVIEVTYTTTSQRSAPGRFTVPAVVCEALGIDKGALVEVEVKSSTGWHGPAAKTLISDREPSPVGEMKDWMKAGEPITVRVRRA
jgi:hypothetical protein